MPAKVLEQWASKNLPMPDEHFQYKASGKPILYEELDLNQPWESFDIGHELTRKGIEKFHARTQPTRCVANGTKRQSFQFFGMYSASARRHKARQIEIAAERTREYAFGQITFLWYSCGSAAAPYGRAFFLIHEALVVASRTP